MMNQRRGDEQYERNLMAGYQGNAVGAAGAQLSAAQQEGQNEYNRTWGNWSAGLGLLTSDERLKKYRECSKKVVIHTPSKLQALKYTSKGE
jgi:hypothetical protein